MGITHLAPSGKITLTTALSYSIPSLSFGPSKKGTQTGALVAQRPSNTSFGHTQQFAAAAAAQSTSKEPVEEYFGGMSQARLKRLAETDGAEDVENKKPKTDGM